MRVVLAVIGLGLAILVAIKLMGGSAHTVPPMFDPTLTLQSATAQASDQNRAVLLYATADWCGPCQHFKRTTLVDPTVEDYVSRLLIPVYLDIDDHKDIARQLAIRSIPTVILLKGDREVARVSGVVPATDLVAWMREATGYE